MLREEANDKNHFEGVDLEVKEFDVVKQLPEDIVRPLPKMIKSEYPVYTVNFHPEEDMIALGTAAGNVQIWQLGFDENKLLKEFDALHQLGVRDICFSDSGHLLFTTSSDGWIKAICTKKLKVVWSIKKAHDHPITRLIVIDDKKIATGDEMGVIKVWDINSGKKIVQFDEHADFISGFDYHEDTERLYASSGDGTISGYDLAENTCIDVSEKSNKDEDYTCLITTATNNKSHILVGTSKGRIAEFSAKSWVSPARFHYDKSSRKTEAISTLLFLTDKMVAITYETDPVIYIYNVKPRYRFVDKLGDHDDVIHQLALSKEAAYIASAGDNGVKFWNAAYLFGNSLDFPDEIEAAQREEEQKRKEKENLEDHDDSDDDSLYSDGGEEVTLTKKPIDQPDSDDSEEETENDKLSHSGENNQENDEVTSLPTQMIMKKVAESSSSDDDNSDDDSDSDSSDEGEENKRQQNADLQAETMSAPSTVLATNAENEDKKRKLEESSINPMPNKKPKIRKRALNKDADVFYEDFASAYVGMYTEDELNWRKQ